MIPPRPLVVLLAVAVLAIAGVDGATITHRAAVTPPKPATPHATSTRSATAAAPPPSAAVDMLLEQRTAALVHRDLASFTALLDPAATAFVAAQRAQFVALAQLPLSDVTYTEDAASAGARGPVAGHGGAPTFAPTVTYTYELSGFDTTPVTATEVDTFVQRGNRWLLASDSDFGAPPPQVWQQGPLHVVRGARSLVIAQSQTASLAQAVADEVDRDVPAVTAIWGDAWPKQAAVLLPSTTAELGALVGESGDLSQIAAVETSEVGIDPAGAARIAINPTPYTSLSALGRQVVLTHELTHVASRDATTSSSPLWLVEGLADDVGFSRTGLSARTIAAELRTRVLAGYAPTALPADGEFRSDAANLTSAYELSWLACRLIVSKIGESGLVGLYRDVGRPADPGADESAAVAAALQGRLHETTAQFTSEWIAFVHQQLA